ncbi:hypothetical protein BH09MYX1_BH09MYX1_13740 [soil metagenome]
MGSAVFYVGQRATTRSKVLDVSVEADRPLKWGGESFLEGKVRCTAPRVKPLKKTCEDAGS